MFYIDVDVCFVKVEVEWVVMCLCVLMVLVCNGGIWLLVNFFVMLKVVLDGFDEVDKWIVVECGVGDVVVILDILLVDCCLKVGVQVIQFNGEVLIFVNIGGWLVMCDLMQDLWVVDLFLQGKGGGFGKVEWVQFL